MNTDIIIIVLSCLAILSYLFDIIARNARIPSVLLLIFMGLFLQLLFSYLQIPAITFNRVLPVLGTIGLILIVLEGSLELKFTSEKADVIKKSFFASLFILLLSSTIITLVFMYYKHQRFQIAFVNSVPFSIISSAIVLPSVAHLSDKKKEFLVYESIFSDILGIMLFNFALNNSSIDIYAFINLTADTLVIIVISVVACALLFYLLGRITHHIKFFLIISILILIYAVGKLVHLSSLLIILAFGLLLNNIELIKSSLLKKHFFYTKLDADLYQLFTLTAESAFIVRTFFFLVFGYTIDLVNLNELVVVKYGFLILCIIIVLRLICLKLILRSELIPELFTAPRGLISILLLYNVPEKLQIDGSTEGILLFVILGTSLLMSLGLMVTRKSAHKKAARE